MVSFGKESSSQSGQQVVNRFDPNNLQSQGFITRADPKAEQIGQAVDFELPNKVVDPIDAKQFFNTTQDAILNPLSNLQLNEAQQNLINLTQQGATGQAAVRGIDPSFEGILQATSPALVEMGKDRAAGLANLAQNVVIPQQRQAIDERGQDIDATLTAAGLNTGREQSSLNAFLDLIALTQDQAVVTGSNRGSSSGFNFGLFGSDANLKYNIKTVTNALEVL